MHYGDLETAEKMLATRTGLQAKYLSKSIREMVQLRAEWNKQRYSVMYALVAVKFRDATLRKRLLDTQQSELKEWVKSWEGYWSALSYSGQTGKNMLGRILMKVREFIRTQQNPPHNALAVGLMIERSAMAITHHTLDTSCAKTTVQRSW